MNVLSAGISGDARELPKTELGAIGRRVCEPSGIENIRRDPDKRDFGNSPGIPQNHAGIVR
jgi:hypothetical protein